MHRPFAKREPAAADKLVTWRPTKLKLESRAYPPKWDECWLSIGMGWRNRAPRITTGVGTAWGPAAISDQDPPRPFFD